MQNGLYSWMYSKLIWCMQIDELKLVVESVDHERLPLDSLLADLPCTSGTQDNAPALVSPLYMYRLLDICICMSVGQSHPASSRWREPACPSMHCSTQCKWMKHKSSQFACVPEEEERVWRIYTRLLLYHDLYQAVAIWMCKHCSHKVDHGSTLIWVRFHVL